MAAFPLFALAGAILILGYAWWSQPPRRARRALRGKARAAIGGVKHGDWAKITGVVIPLEPLLTSPIGQQACVGFRLDVESVGGAAPATSRRDACGVFGIGDDTGMVRVEGPFLLGLAATGELSTIRPSLLDLAEAAGAPPLVLPAEPGFAYREALLKPGDRVTVFGLASREPDPTEHALRSAPVVLRMRGSTAQPVIVAAADEPTSA
jgi:hypothetical protein